MAKGLVVACALVAAAPARAVQPLEAFLRGAREAGVDNAEARALRAEGAARERAELGRALPRLSLRGEYVRNEDEETLLLPGAGGAPEPVTLTPLERADLAASLEVPLVDLARFARIGAARAGARAAVEEERSIDLRVQARVSREYHGLVAALALGAAARRALEVAEAGLRVAGERHGAGSGGLLDVERARAEVERNVQLVARAELEVSLRARALRSLSGISPGLEGEPPPPDDLREEPPLERFLPEEEEVPAVAAAVLRREAAEREARAERLALVPSLDAVVTERVTTAEELSGGRSWWQAVVGLTWSIDFSTLPAIRARRAAADAAAAREQRARLEVRDEVHRAWQTVRTFLVRSRSARVEAEVSARAAGLALERYRAGAAEQLDLLQAQRAAFDAEAARILADAELGDARAQLRLAAGESLLQPLERGTP